MGDPEIIKRHAMASLKIGESLKDKHIAVRSYNFLGASYDQRGNVEMAFEHYSKALRIAEQIGDKGEMVRSYNNLGVVFWHKSEWDKAIDYLEKSLHKAQEIDDKKWIAACYCNLGLVYQDKENWNKAIEYQLKSIEIKRKRGDAYGLGISYLNIGIVYTNLGDWDKAVEYFHRALVEDEKIGRRVGMALCYDNLGQICLKRGKWDKAIESFGESLKMGEKVDSDWVVAAALGNLGEAHFLQNDLAIAQNFYERGIKLCEHRGYKKELVNMMRRFADLLISLEELGSAEQYLRKALLLAKEIGTPIEMATVRRSLGILSYIRGERKEAEGFFESSIKILEGVKPEYELGRTHLEFGKLLKAENDRERALHHLQRAKDIFHKLGATADLESAISLVEDLKRKELRGKDLRLAILQNLSRIVSRVSSVNELEQQVMKYLTKALLFDGCAIFFEQRAPAYFGRVKKSEAEAAYNKKEMVLSPYLFVPFKEGGGIYFEGKEIPFKEEDNEFIESISDYVALGIKKLSSDEELKKLKVAEISEKYKKCTYGELIGESAPMQEVFDLISRISGTRANVLIRGETGTGKELVARTIHLTSQRKDKPFIKINCAAIPEPLLESELFGIEKGTATDVVQRIGKLEQADRGTVLLDEIGDMTTSTQAKILRIIQEKEFERVGGRKTMKVDVRMIAATHKDLEEAIRLHEFREDLYYRLNVVTIQIPLLSERKEDIPLLVAHFIEKYNAEHNRQIKGITPEVMDRFMRYDWHGNVRELENVIERAIILAEGDVITLRDIPPALYGIKEDVSMKTLNLKEARKIARLKAIESIERDFIIEALRKSNWSASKAAKHIGVTYRHLYRLMRKYGIKRETQYPALQA